MTTDPSNDSKTMGNQRMGCHCAELSEPWVGASSDEGRPKRPTATRTFRARSSTSGHAKKELRGSVAFGEEGWWTYVAASHDLQRFGTLATTEELNEQHNDGLRMDTGFFGGHFPDGGVD